MTTQFIGFCSRSVLLPFFIVVTCCFGCDLDGLQAADWPQFRGPQGNGKLEKILHPLEWSEKKNVAWKIKSPGTGWSSPLIIGDKIYITSAVGKPASRPKNMSQGVKDLRSMPFMPTPKPPTEQLTFGLTCYNLQTGKELWTRNVAELPPDLPIHPSNTYATETAVSDGKHVVVYFGTVGLLALYDLNGNQLWNKKFDPLKIQNGMGPGSSLALNEGVIYLQRDYDKKSFLHAIKLMDSKEIWKKNLPEGAGWATPVVWKSAGRTELVRCGKGHVSSHDLLSGEELWAIDSISSSFTSSPTFTRDRIVFGNSGPFGSFPMYSVLKGAKGKLADPSKGGSSSVEWKARKVNIGMGSPVIANGKVFTAGNGIVKVYRLNNGEMLYQKRLPESKIIVASAWCDDEHVFLLDESGRCYMLGTGDEYKLLRTNRLEDTFWSTPAVSGKNLIMRGIDSIYCIRSRD